MALLLNYPSGCLSTKDQWFYKACSQHARLSVGCRDKCRSWIISPQTSGHTLSMLILSACLPCRPQLWQLYLLDRDVNRQDSCNYRTGAKTISTYSTSKKRQRTGIHEQTKSPSWTGDSVCNAPRNNNYKTNYNQDKLTLAIFNPVKMNLIY